MVVGSAVRVWALLCQKEPQCSGGGSGSVGSGGGGGGFLVMVEKRR